ncbi:MAG: hypothetical protein R3182_12900 [Draconibacterium sp.]|nr:hypothetical protein [Draconibacterium sp.]
MSALCLFAQNEIGPEGGKLIWVFLIIALAILALILFLRKLLTKNKSSNKPVFKRQKVKVNLDKDSLYYPDYLELTVKNSGNVDVDMDKPLLVFDNFWLKRKFRLKGMDNRSFYPLYLEKGKTHTLKIDLNRFYFHDKSLKKFPKAKIIVYNVKGKNLGSKSVYLRKTLFKF